MRIFLAGATGVIGTRLAPLLIAAGHEVAGMTRSHERAESLQKELIVVVADVLDRHRVIEAVGDFSAEMVIHQVTALPDDPALIGEFTAANARIRREGTDNLLEAARRAGAGRFLAQSVAWRLEGEAGSAVEHLESAVLDYGGTVLRYGQFYGPGTYHEHELPPAPRIHIDEAAETTARLLDARPGVVEIIEPDRTA